MKILKKRSWCFGFFGLTELFAVGMLLTFYDANLRAVFSSTVTIKKPFQSFEDINAKIRDKKVTLLLRSFATVIYERINYTITPEFESLRNALAVHPPRLVPNHE